MTTVVIAIASLALAITAAVTIVGIKPVFAPPTTCHGCAVDFAPGQEFKDDPKADSAKSFAPGQLAEVVPFPCGLCDAKDFAPGQQGLEAGIIGPEIKK